MSLKRWFLVLLSGSLAATARMTSETPPKSGWLAETVGSVCSAGKAGELAAGLASLGGWDKPAGTAMAGGGVTLAATGGCG